MPAFDPLLKSGGLSDVPGVSTPEPQSKRPERRTGMARCGCGAEWGGLSAAHCAGCHQTFTSVSGFTAHRKGGQCHDPHSLGMVPADRKWLGWALPGSYDPTAAEEAP